MKLSDWDDNVFSEGEITALDNWREHMKHTPLGKQIIDNMEKDPHVPEDILMKFLKNLAGRINQGDDKLTAVKNAITDDILLMGLPIIKKKLPDNFSKLMKVRRLFGYLNDNIPIFRDIETRGLIFNWIRNGILTIEKNFKDIKLQENLPVCWSIFSLDLDCRFDLSGTINELYDQLGLSDFDEGDYVVELLFEKDKIRNPRIATFIEAGVDPFFYPGLREDESGFTFDLKSWDFGIPEIIHEPITFHDISAISCKYPKSETALPFHKRLKHRRKEYNEIIDLKEIVSNIEKMNTLPLIKYIEERLKGIRVIPPLSARSNEPPEFFLEKIYESNPNNRFKARFRDSIAKLLSKEQKENLNPNYLATLLILCEQYTISEAFTPVADMISSGKLKGRQSIYGDLHHRAMMALARMPQGKKMTAQWLNAIEDERYTAAAFAALREQGLDKIIINLPRFIRIYQEKSGSIDMDIALLTLYESYQTILPKEEITKLILLGAKNEYPTLKNHLDSILPKVFLHSNILNNSVKLLPAPADSGVQNYSLKSIVCCKLLSHIVFEANQVIQDMNLWILIAILEDNSCRQTKWIELVCQVEQGKFNGVKF